MVWLLILAGIGLLLAPAGVALYRHLTAMRLDARSALAQIEEQMHRRHGLLAKLIEEAPSEHAEELRRAQLSPEEAKTVQEKAEAERLARARLASMLNRLEGLEHSLLDDLERTRLKIDFAATYYNLVVDRYNRKLSHGPLRWLSRLFGFRPRDPFDLDDPAEHGSH